MAATSTNQIKDQSLSLTKRLFPWTLYALIPIALLHFYLNPLSFPPSPESELPHSFTSHFSPPSEDEKAHDTPCDYFNGKWVSDKRGPLYNGTTCGTIKENQNCIKHGKLDMGYLYWRWKPNSECQLPRFDPHAFLNVVSNKHLAFVGDSMARNQLESLLCMLATASSSTLLFSNDSNKFRRWHFSSHNATVSVYWSPFLVKGVEKSSSGPDHNELYLDHVDEKWGGDMGQMDLIVLSIGHWFLHPAIYYEDGSVLGCHYCPGLNHSAIGFYGVLRKALRTTLNGIIDRRGGKGNDGVGVIVTTFSPAHFEGEWDKAGACPKTRPYRNEEKKLEGMDAEMREIEMEEVEAAKVKAKGIGGFRLEALDVTRLALLRPDGHPGPYMYPFPFANGVQEHMQNDCVHWCLPGPIDTWNEIFLEILKKWEEQHKSEE
ncbi:protein ALTERED XYLOGLUCAN 4-like [Glycine soja]|uniref:Protein ALTERED XYLOGLUCAN 4 n=2 Tax=Glycine soja TaxID=3848 RepID=A0A445JLT0_GLYSO|nr:protein ALTERED XYLOGLUCAN 4-like [Glycine soja]RZB99364.1 Protein ALTERED XYLOGLUCAN 4 [Glycine soja]